VKITTEGTCPMSVVTKRRLALAVLLAGVAISTGTGVAAATTDSTEPIWATVVDDSAEATADATAAAERECPDAGGAR